MKLSKPQCNLLDKVAAGWRIITRGRTLDMNPCVRLKARNGYEKTLNYGTVRKLMELGLLARSDTCGTYELTPAGREAAVWDE